MMCSLLASAADGLTAVGANVILLPSTYYDNDIEWKAWTWVYKSGLDFGQPYNTENPNYNLICGIPDEEDNYGPRRDAEGRFWYEPGFDMSAKEGDVNYDVIDEETGLETPIVWEEHTAPFCSDPTWGGRQTYQWTTYNIMADIYVRRTFTIPEGQMLSGPVYLACGHDDAPAEYYLNGVMVYCRTGWETNDAGNIINGWNNAEYVMLSDEQKELIKLNGEENVLAFHVHQNWGGAFADGGLYTKIEGGLDMGYTTPWEGKVLFNNAGGYNRDGASPSNNPRHPWSKLYEAQEGDEYSFTLNGSSDPNYDGFEPGREKLEFRTPIKIEAERSYHFTARVLADKPFSAFTIQLCDNDDETLEAAYEEMEIEAPAEGEEESYEGTLIDIFFEGMDGLNNFKAVFDFSGGQDTTAITIKDISLTDVTESEEGEELWVGTHYFNIFDMHKGVVKYMVWDVNENGEDYQREAVTDEERENADIVYSYEEIDAPELTGRTETMAWTLPDFDDSMWDDQMMPTGSAGYMPELQTIWPSGTMESTEWSSNYWIRRNFELEEINEKLSYELNVCHDDVYETYVNGHLLQKNVGWTNGKNPVQVHIPARFLNIGKNVIATYIQQNWGGYFYDCGINVTEVNYDECLKLFQDALAYAQTDTLLTNGMKADVQSIIDRAQQFFAENGNDAAELRSYARDSITPRVNSIFAYSNDVKLLKDTYDITRREGVTGYWTKFLDAAVAALDTCTAPSQWTATLNGLRDARKAAHMEVHTEKYVGVAEPKAVTIYEAGEEMGDYIYEYDDEETGNLLTLDTRPKYYLYNVGAKNFLGAGEAWGTHLAVEYVSNPMMLIQAQKEILDEEGNWLEDEIIEGGYFIESFRPNGAYGDMDFVGWNGFIDVNRGDNVWEIIPVPGKENVFNIAQYGQTFATDTTYTEDGEMVVTGGGKKYLGLRCGDNAFEPSYYIVDTDNKTAELETNQWKFVTREEMLALAATASEDNPVDLSFLMVNPGYDQRLPLSDLSDWNESTIEGWQFSNDGGNVSIWGRNNNYSNFTFEAFNASFFSMFQELDFRKMNTVAELEDSPLSGQTFLPAGTYMLEVQGYYRDGLEDVHAQKYLSGQPTLQRAYVYAGKEIEDLEGSYAKVALAPIHIASNQVPGIGWTDANKQMRVPGTYSGQMGACAQAAMEYFPVGCYWNKIAFRLEEPGYVNIGIFKDYDEDPENQVRGDWCVMDNWRLKYYGGEEIDPDAIKGIESDEIKRNTLSADKSIYNMLGQRLSKAQKGVNIIGGKKIIKK